MVLILLSSPNHLNPLWPATPRSLEVSALSPRTPLTPSPSFFAILSPIFTPDDNLPASPGALLQVSPGVIPPETPPPWLLGPRSPIKNTRPTFSRSNSYYDAPTPNLPRDLTGDKLVPRSYQRPAMPSTTYSFTAGHAQVFRPPPPLTLKRMRTEPITSGVFSPFRQALNSSSSRPVPELKVRPPSLEQLTGLPRFEEDLVQSPEVETLTISMMGLEVEPSTPMDGETMDIPILLEAPCSVFDAQYFTPLENQSVIDVSARRNLDTKHSRSPSAPVASCFKNLTATSSLKAQPQPKQTHQTLEFKPRPHRVTMSVANLQQFDRETGCAHLRSRQELR